MLESRRLDFLLIFFLSVVALAILGSVTVKLQSLSTLLVTKPVLILEKKKRTTGRTVNDVVFLHACVDF